MAASLDIVSDEPGVRLGCLELYVRLARGCHNRLENGAHFAVEEDQRQRVLVHWRHASSSGSAAPDQTSPRSRGGLGEQTWRVSCAFAPNEPEDALFETLGTDAVEWLWDGLSAFVLVLAPSDAGDAVDQSLFGGGVYASGPDIDTTAKPAPSTTGLLQFCFEELCRRVEAEADGERYCLGLSVWELLGSEAHDLLDDTSQDAASELRFETVRFRTVADAMALLEQVGLGRARPTSPSSRRTARARGHVFVRAVVFDAQRETMAALHVAAVACGNGREGPNALVVSDRHSLWDLLDAASTGDAPEPKTSCRLTEIIAPLVAGNCKAFVLCTVPEQPRNQAAVTEAHELLDLAERASLITAQCTRVQGVGRDDFQLAEISAVIGRAQRVDQGRDIGEDAPSLAAPLVNAASQLGAPAVAAEVKETADETTVTSPTELAGPSLSDCSTAPAPATTNVLAAPAPSRPPEAVSYSAAKLSWAPGSPKRSTFLDDEVVNFDGPSNVSPAQVQPNQSISSRPIASDASSGAASANPGVVKEPQLDSLGSLGARIAQAACIDECRELSEACLALRAENETKAKQRKQELRAVHAEVAALREAIAGFEGSCGAPEVIDGFKSEVQALRLEAARLREENAALAGAKGQEARRGAQHATLQALKIEVARLRQSTVGLEQGEKRANLVNHCLNEVRVRLDVAKRRLAEAEREIAALQPAYGELGRQIEHSERRRRWAQEELDRLRRASGGLRAEIAQLRQVRDCVDSLPTAAAVATAPPSPADGTTGAGLERFAALQRRLATAAPQLVPLCTRARAEMEELVRCCQHLEERQRRLQQVAPLADDADGNGGGGSCGSSVASGATGSAGLRRARSSDAASLTGSHWGGGGRLPMNLRPAASEAPPGFNGNTHSARTTPRSATPRAVTPAASTPRGSRLPGREASPRRAQSAASYGSALRSWVLERDASRHGTKQRRGAAGGGRLVNVPPRDACEGVEGAVGALRDLGLQLPTGRPASVQGVHLTPEATPRCKSKGRMSRESSEPRRMAASLRARSRSR